MTEDCKQHKKGDGSSWLYDGVGIPLCRVCYKCEEEKKSKYNPWVFKHYNNEDTDDNIDTGN